MNLFFCTYTMKIKTIKGIGIGEGICLHWLWWYQLNLGYIVILNLILNFDFFNFKFLYPEWPHRQGSFLARCGCTFESSWGCTDLYYARGAQGVLPMRVGGATSQLDLSSLTTLSVAGCGWLQLGVPHWAASVHYC